MRYTSRYASIQEVYLHLLVKVATDHIGIEAGSGSLFKFFNSPTTCFDGIDDVCDLLFGLGYLTPLFLFRIGVHKRQTDIGFRHDD